jgi:stearoyl-CoA desaturase (delta-9 desaturase)
VTTEGETVSFLSTPRFPYTKDGVSIYRPTLREVAIDWLDAIHVFADARKLLVLYSVAFHIGTGVLFVLFLRSHPSWKMIGLALLNVSFIGTVHHTIWYHRYCSHRSFRFSSIWFARLFLWTNPFLLREECYAVMHGAHHKRSDDVGDPAGPHLGWLGCYLAFERGQNLDTGISESDYARLRARVAHLGAPMNDHRGFLRTGSIERVPHYLARTVFAQAMWSSLAYAAGGREMVLLWYATVFFTWYLVRDFNWWGHRRPREARVVPGWEVETHTLASNQRFYGYVGSEWHANHHKYPRSANSGFFAGQPDVAFEIIRIMRELRIVESFIDMTSSVEGGKARRYGPNSPSSAPRTPIE